MDPTDSSSRIAPLPITDYLSLFKIEVSSGSEFMYENGRQQVELTLSVAERDGYILTEAELNILTVVHRTPNGQYEPLPATPQDTTDEFEWFLNSARDERFEYFPLQAKSKCNSTAKKNNFQSVSQTKVDIKTRTFYITTTAPGGSSIELFAQIEICGEPYTTGVDFVSTAHLTAVALPNYTEQDYTWVKSWFEGNPPSAAFINEWSLAANKARFSYAEELADKPYGMIRWQVPAEGERNASNVGLAFPREKEFKYNPKIRVSDDFLLKRHTVVQSPDPYEIVVVLQASNIITYDSASFAENGPCTVDAYDINGNSHRVTFAFDLNQTTEYKIRTNLEVIILSPTKNAIRYHTDGKRAPPEALK